MEMKHSLPKTVPYNPPVLYGIMVVLLFGFLSISYGFFAVVDTENPAWILWTISLLSLALVPYGVLMVIRRLKGASSLVITECEVRIPPQFVEFYRKKYHIVALDDVSRISEKKFRGQEVLILHTPKRQISTYKLKVLISRSHMYSTDSYEEVKRLITDLISTNAINEKARMRGLKARRIGKENNH